MKKLLLIFCVALFISGAFAIQLQSAQDKYVNDFAHILNAQDTYELRYLFQSVEENTTAQVVFVSVGNASGYDPSEYATMIGQQWGVGMADKDNGVVILYVVDVNKIWVSTGYGVEGVLPDSKVGRMLDTYYVPLRDQGNVSQGITQFSFALAQELQANREELLSSQRSQGSVDVFFIFFVIFIIFIIVGSFVRRSRAYRRIWWLPIFFPSGSGSGGGGFGGGFGGGSFGGGGAGR